MSRKNEFTRCAFVVCKLRIEGEVYVVVRYDVEWEDITLVGGHQEEEDEGQFAFTARRETLEELNDLAESARFKLVPLTGELEIGPIWSRSARSVRRYKIVFYSLRFLQEPTVRLREKGDDEYVRFMKERDLMANQGNIRKSRILELVQKEVPGGIEAIPLSWDWDLKIERGC